MNKNQLQDPVGYIYDFLKGNLQGPRNGKMHESEEYLDDHPTLHYKVGILWPYNPEKEKDSDKNEFQSLLYSGTRKEDDESPDEIEKIQNNGKNNQIQVNNDIQDSSNIEDNIIKLTYQRNPSAMGVSFNLAKGSDLTFEIFGAQYVHKEVPLPNKKTIKELEEKYQERIKKSLKDKNEKYYDILTEALEEYDKNQLVVKNYMEKILAEKKKKDWKTSKKFFRQELNTGKISISNKEIPEKTGEQVEKDVLKDDPKLVLILKKISKETYTAYLFNKKTDETDSNRRSNNCFYQVEFTINSSKDFLPYLKENPLNDSDETANFNMLYSDYSVLAAGHGCSPIWDNNSSIKAVHLPKYEIKQVRATQLEIDGKIKNLSMELLSDNKKKDEIFSLLEQFVLQYKTWIKSQEALILENIPEIYHQYAKDNLKQCLGSHDRMLGGVECLKSKPMAFKAFCLMNKAMLLQQIRYNADKWRKEHQDNSKKPPVIEDKDTWPNLGEKKGREVWGNWRPFQLGFILMNIEGTYIDKENDKLDDSRKIVDLIWFPTGGGKTEAYFGLSAFIIFMRRLDNPDDRGTAVISRYTLRLLTTQQFQRTAALITACDLIRRRNQELLGEHAIRLGMWVGKAATPNKRIDAKQKFEKLKYLRSRNYNKENYIINNHNFSLQECPSCNISLFNNITDSAVQAAKNLGMQYKRKVKTSRGKKDTLIFICPNKECDYFEERIPVDVIDEHLYEESVAPTFIISTVDKFALVTYRPESASFFSLRPDQLEQRPPDLIIQDELHLISGALGSIYGIYEKLLNELYQGRQSCYKNFYPKIVCSTATINSAEYQIHNLYGRKEKNLVNVFPSNGIKIWDNYFSEVNHKKKGRTYIGIMRPTGEDVLTIKKFILAALLQAGKQLETLGYSEQIVNNYWTLVDYYNSKRELSMGSSVIESDVKEHFRFLTNMYNLGKNERRYVYPSKCMEMTGRDPSHSITDMIKRLSTDYSRDLSYQKALDTCVTTNMFSVGIDISRLGLMNVTGQPKSTSEYIQATSRVGRSLPGIVTVQFSPNSRDRSHFEHFQSFHSRLYAQVEPTSVTPFSYGSIDRSLSSIIIAFIRIKCGVYSPHLIQDDQIEDCSNFIKKISELCNTKEEKEYLLSKSKDILDKIKNNRNNYNGGFQHWVPDNDKSYLFYPPTITPKKKNPPYFNVPTSMRDVDDESWADIFTQSYPEEE